MPRTTVTAQVATRGGITATFTALASGAGNGAQFAYDQSKRTEIRVRNPSTTAAATVTFLFNTANASIDGQVAPNPSASVAASGELTFRPLNEFYRQSDGNCYVECSAAVDIALIRNDPS